MYVLVYVCVYLYIMYTHTHTYVLGGSVTGIRRLELARSTEWARVREPGERGGKP